VIKSKEDIPEKPGVYLFKKKTGDILYIGKAKNLKKLVEQYFQRADHPVIGNLLKQADDIEFVLTDDERDALLLEFNFIQNYKPPFNVRLKDDKSFPSIEITVKDEFPAIYFTRKPKPGSFAIGPIVSAKKTRDLIDMVTRLFKIRSCRDSLFNKGAACLYHYIGRCSAPCVDKGQMDDYRQRVKDTVAFLKGEKSKILRNLEKRMKEMAEELRFEEAQQMKEDIRLIDDFDLDSYISTHMAADYDVVAVNIAEREVFAVQFSVVGGKVRRREYYDFPSFAGDSPEVLQRFLMSLYKRGQVPPQILVPFSPEEPEALMEVLSESAGRKVEIKVPQRGDKKNMLQLAVKNLNHFVNKNNYDVVGTHVKDALKLKRFPSLIEGYDISHLSERDRVGAVVVFARGKAVKSEYRNYIIKNSPPGDTEAIKEVLERRFKKKDAHHPDLLMIDGGLGQLSAALEIKKKLGITSDVVALAKKEERIFLEHGGSFLFPKGSPELFLFQNIRDDVHRRAVTHHRKRRQKI
jgi:excinuclease ABC subunit C